jgi:hypothetical protein
LTWKLKGTKFNRLLFQLQPKTLRIAEIDAGLLESKMLPTICPGTHGRGGIPHKGVVNALLSGEKPKVQELLVDRVFAMELKKQGVNHVETFRNFQIPKMLPTPTASDRNQGTTKIHPTYPRHTDLNNLVSQQTGQNSQLNPRFVAEMMGFPPNWTELPFLNGDKNQSKDTVTQ